MKSYYPALPRASNKIQINLEMVGYAQRGGEATADLRTGFPLELLRTHYPDAPVHIATLPPVDVSSIIQLPTPGYHVGKAVKTS